MPIKAVGQSAASEDFLELSYSYRILNLIGQIPNSLKFERNSCCLMTIIIVFRITSLYLKNLVIFSYAISLKCETNRFPYSLFSVDFVVI